MLHRPAARQGTGFAASGKCPLFRKDIAMIGAEFALPDVA
jgi:hypothetical protein